MGVVFSTFFNIPREEGSSQCKDLDAWLLFWQLINMGKKVKKVNNLFRRHLFIPAGLFETEMEPDDHPGILTVVFWRKAFIRS